MADNTTWCGIMKISAFLQILATCKKLCRSFCIWSSPYQSLILCMLTYILTKISFIIWMRHGTSQNITKMAIVDPQNQSNFDNFLMLFKFNNILYTGSFSWFSPNYTILCVMFSNINSLILIIFTHFLKLW